jgi:hypothetical protein
MSINLINFHKYPSNSKFVKESKLYYSHPDDGYFIVPTGNGYNQYIITVEYNQTQHKILFEEKHIMNWIIYTNGSDYIEFEAIGKNMHTQMYQSFYSTDCDNFSYLNGKYKIIDISVNSTNLHARPISIHREIDMLDLYDTKQINKLMEFKLDTTNCIQINLEELDMYVNNMIFFVIDNVPTKIYPFEIKSLKQIDNQIFMSGYIYYELDKYFIDKIEISNRFVILDPDDKYNLEISFVFDQNDIFDYCYIMAKY